MFSLAALSILDGFGHRVPGADGAEGALEEDALEGIVAAEGSSPAGFLARLLDHPRKPGRGSQHISGGEASDVTDAGDELRLKDCRPSPAETG